MSTMVPTEMVADTTVIAMVRRIESMIGIMIETVSMTVMTGVSTTQTVTRRR